MVTNPMTEALNERPLVLYDHKRTEHIETADIYLPNVPQCERFFELLRSYMLHCHRIKTVYKLKCVAPSQEGKWAYLRIKYHEDRHFQIREAIAAITYIRENYNGN